MTNVNVPKVLTYIDLSATAVGISPEFSFYLVSIANAGSGLGRISSGFFADKFGPLTIIAPLTLLCAIVTYVWPFATTKGSLVAIAVIYGLCYGTYGSLGALPIVMMGDTHDAGRRTGTALMVIALGAIAGPPISGAIAQTTDGFKTVGYYAGIVSLPSPPTLDPLLKWPPPLSLSLRIVHRWRCGTPVPHQIPDDWQSARKILTLESEGQRVSLRPVARSMSFGTEHRSCGGIDLSAQAGALYKNARFRPIFYPPTTTRHHTVIYHIIFCFWKL